MLELFFLPHPQKSREYNIPQRQLKNQILKIHVWKLGVLELDVLQILRIWHKINKDQLAMPILKGPTACKDGVTNLNVETDRKTLLSVISPDRTLVPE